MGNSILCIFSTSTNTYVLRKLIIISLFFSPNLKVPANSRIFLLQAYKRQEVVLINVRKEEHIREYLHNIVSRVKFVTLCDIYTLHLHTSTYKLNMNSSETKRSIKLVVVGDGTCGKTSLLTAFKVQL